MGTHKGRKEELKLLRHLSQIYLSIGKGAKLVLEGPGINHRLVTIKPDIIIHYFQFTFTDSKDL